MTLISAGRIGAGVLLKRFLRERLKASATDDELEKRLAEELGRELTAGEKFYVALSDKHALPWPEMNRTDRTRTAAHRKDC
jgi:hypothetical protein